MRSVFLLCTFLLWAVVGEDSLSAENVIGTIEDNSYAPSPPAPSPPAPSSGFAPSPIPPWQGRSYS